MPLKFSAVFSLFFFSWAVAGCGAKSALDGVKADFYVSPRGSDASDGRAPERAFRTLERARDAARERAEPSTVALDDGVWELSGPLEFTERDRNLVFQAAPGAKPVISAGMRITGWQVGSDGRWRARVPQGTVFSQFYVNSQRRVRPFLPREGYYYVQDGAEPADGKARFVVGAEHFPDGDNPGLEVCMFNVWTMSRSHVKEYDKKTCTVTLDLRPGKRDFDIIGEGRWYRYDNVASALGEPGDWYLDRKTGEIVYVPLPGETPENCQTVASRFENVALFDRATNIVWRGVTFAHQDYGVHPGGNYCGQSATVERSAVEVERSSGIRFERCAFIHTGSYALSFSKASADCAAVGCEFRDLGAGGVKIGEGRFSGDKRDMTRRCEVSGCLIAGGGRVNPAGVGVWIGHAVGNLVSHNTIRDIYYSGVSAGWNWSLTETSRDNVIEWNHIHDIGRGVLSDMGGIYLLGSQPGTVERFNHIHDITRARNCAFGIYFDSGTSHVVVSNNVVHDCQDSNFFVAAISASNRVENNIFAFGPARQLHGPMRNPKSSPTLFDRNIVAWDEGVFTDGFPGSDTVGMSGNFYWCPDDARPDVSPRGGTYVPQPFADFRGRDLRLADGAAGRLPGFIPFSIEGCGRTEPAALTAGMPEVPRVFFPAPPPERKDLMEDNESVAAGSPPSGWSILSPDGTDNVRITDRAAYRGSRSIEVVDDRKDWRPHLYRDIMRDAGDVLVSFALKTEGGAQPRIELRGGIHKINFRVASDGTLSAMGKPVVKLETGKWHRIGIGLRLGPGRVEHVCRLTVTDEKGADRRFTVPIPRRFTFFNWIGIHSCGVVGRYYIDDFSIVEEDRNR